MRPDTVCGKYADDGRLTAKKKLSVQLLVNKRGKPTDLVLIEGEAGALEFLGKLLIAQAHYKKDCGFSIGPNSAGCAFFKKNSTLGFYIHRLPCLEETGLKMAKPAPEPPPVASTMKFSEVYSKVIGLWPAQIDISDGSITKGEYYLFRKLSDEWDRIEDEVGYQDPWAHLMVWTMFQAFHEESIRLIKNKLNVLEPAKVDLKKIEYYYHRGMTEKGSIFKRLLPGYINDIG